MADDKTPPTDPNEGPGKGKAFFDRAKSVAATGNYDYAIDMYIEGLAREPFNTEEHENLRKVSLERKIKGGKPAGGLLGPKLPYKGKSAKDALLNNEFLLAKDPGNIPAMLAIIRNAVALERHEVVKWIGPILHKANETSGKPKKEIFMELADIYEKIKEYNMASKAIRGATELDPTNMELVARAKDLAALETLNKGNYEAGESFKGSIKDQEQTKKLLQEENINKSVEYLTDVMQKSKADYEKNPMELQVIAKYSKSLVDMGDEAHENEAIEVLKKGYQETKIYRLKAGIGDIRMAQFKRNLRMIKDAYGSATDPKEKEELGAQFKSLNKERLSYELEEYRERAEHMPTDMLVKYELGVRLWEAQKFDEAIGAFQEAQQNPKHRVDAMHLLGRSFLNQGMKPEAVETLRRAIEEYDLAPTGDKKSKELHYWYAYALEENGQFAEAIDVYSKIIRWDIGFRDARKRLNDLRAKGGDAPAA